ncbi:signal recognition particle-docking protein FtsY [Williamsia sp. CHRR-6]|uniref:signal recognition particle-docking protein FtsY n=1 Tax=Williamsia sp. CHRR-6 TaxID=2835871 RepID=UPI001BDAA6FE|nr:signal recognition particle-docking protein FtsY [Williamsia sp. CHRR-6]MBT0568355.1 signal recognition particle-docking protein FtsY [Williamsia sp. CHRR-6]
MSTEIIIAIVVAVLVLLAIGVGTGLLLSRRRQIHLDDQTPPGSSTREVDRSGGYTATGGFSFSQGGTDTVEPPTLLPERTDTDGQPRVGDDASVPRDSQRRSIQEVNLPDLPADSISAGRASADPTAPETGAVDTDVEPAVEPGTDTDALLDSAPPLDEIEPVSGRLHRLRGRLARSQGALGKGVLKLLGTGNLDEDSWEAVEDTLLGADLGTATSIDIVAKLRTRLASSTVRTPAEVRELLRSVLVEALLPDLDRSIRALPHADTPAVLLVVGVNGTGKTTTVGKLARVLVADGRRVTLGAADTFRAAAADQLQTWAERVGAEVVRGKEGADPASVAFDAVAAGVADGADVVVVDTAGRLHTKTGLMDELGKVKRVIEKKAKVDEVLLVLDATTGQNGMAQAKVFAEVVDITGVVLTKLDGTAKGGIVFHVQHELGVPVKLVGLGEGADDLAPFEPRAFVDALLD